MTNETPRNNPKTSGTSGSSNVGRVNTVNIGELDVNNDDEWVDVEGTVKRFFDLTEKQSSWIAKQGLLQDETGKIQFTIPKDAVEKNESLDVEKGKSYLIKGVVGNAYDDEIHLKFTKKTQCEKSVEKDEQSQTPTSNTDSLQYALIHKATSLTNHENLEDPNSVESQVARGRGKGTVQNRGASTNDTGATAYDIQVTEGQLEVESGYVMRFVDKELLSLSAFDVIGLDSLETYVAPTNLIENLNPRIRGYLNEYGYVKIRGAYSQTASRFYGVQMGWETEDDVDPWDRIMEVINQVSSTPAAVDYTFVVEGPERWGVEEIAEARGIAESSVRGNVRAVSNELEK